MTLKKTVTPAQRPVVKPASGKFTSQAQPASVPPSAAPASKPVAKSPTKPAPSPPAQSAANPAPPIAAMSPAAAAPAVADKGHKDSANGAAAKALANGQDIAPAKVGKGKDVKKIDDVDLADIEADLEPEEPEGVSQTASQGVDETAGENLAETKAKPLRMKVSRAKERALMREFGLDETTLTEEEVAKRRLELKTLIKMGKTRGFLTHQEINDHLPEKLVDNEILEAIVSMLNDMGIAVYEQAPDAATLLIAGGTTTTATDEEAEEAAEAALSTVDSEFGRTTDPVRMYMREMGSVELLTREGEIEIAKRIEGGLQAMMQAISASPKTIAEILGMADRIAAGEMQISDAVDGFVSTDEADDYVAEEDFDEFDDEDDDDGQGGSKALTKKLEELKAQALVKFAALRSHFEKMRKAFEKEGYHSSAYARAQHVLTEDLMHIRFTVKTIERLCHVLPCIAHPGR